MKKCLFCAALGMMIGESASFGQGFIRLDSYDTTPSPLVTYGNNVPANGVSGAFGAFGAGLDSNWTVGFYFASGVVTADSTAGNGLVSPALSLATGLGSSATFGPFGSDSDGTFFSSYGFNTGLPAGSTITIELVAFPTSSGSYESAGYRAHSAAFTLLTTAAINPIYTPAQAPFTVGSAMHSFSIAAVPTPEPSVMVLAMLGGVGMFALSRRKKT
jgi:hypothetical protein